MVYVALLRGINVGGNNKVSMADLKVVFEKAGMADVRTYINSGNVIFRSDLPATKLVPQLEAAIAAHFGFAVSVVLRSLDQMAKVIATLPDDWHNDTATKCDVMFLQPSIDTPAVIDQLVIKPDIDNVVYVPGAILWCVDRTLVTRSGLLKIVGTDLYKKMTIRNCNTTRKLYSLMCEI